MTKEDFALYETVEVRGEICTEKGLGDKAKIEIWMSREASLYAHLHSILLDAVDFQYKPNVTEKECIDEEWYSDYRKKINTFLLREKIRQKFPFGRKEMTLSLADIVEMARKKAEIDAKRQERIDAEKKAKIEERAEEWKDTLTKVKKNYPEISRRIDTENQKVTVKTARTELTFDFSDSIDDARYEIKNNTEQRTKEIEDMTRYVTEKAKELKEKGILTETPDFEIYFNKYGHPVITCDDRHRDIYTTKIENTTIAYVLGGSEAEKRCEKMEEVERLTQVIEERKKAIEIAERDGLTAQAENHRKHIAFAEKLLPVYKTGEYDNIEYDYDDWNYMDIADYSQTIPADCLTTYDRAKKQDIFDRFEIWEETEDDDPLLIGVVEEGNKRTFFKICGW